MIPLPEVQASVMRSITRFAPVEFARADALGLVLAADVVAGDRVPPFDNTAMDGYAVRAADTEGARADAPVRLRVVGELPAGHAPTVAVGRGKAVRIMTGAPIPEGADAIVIVETTERVGEAGDAVDVFQAAAVGDHVRPAGGDVEVGQVVFPAGTQLGPAHLGVLASIDVHEVSVYPRARVGVISTGDELVEAGPLTPGRIRDSNRPMLLGLVEASGMDAVDLGIARDDEDVLTRTLEEALSACDAIVTSGGVSVGDYDYMSAALQRIAATGEGADSRVDWYQVAIRPSKPLCFAVLHGKPVFGLPGNPVSSRVSFELFARPALRHMMGHAVLERPVVAARAEHAMRRRRDGKLHLDRVRVRLDESGRYVVSSTGGQASNELAATAAADGLVLLADGEGVDAGADVRVMLLG
jgi:molybdenum cofactor synthesis domain-containing protein